jgi:hypothetical protein
MKYLISTRTWFTLAVIFSIFVSCQKPFDSIDKELNLNPEFAFPLVDTRFAFLSIWDDFDKSGQLEMQSDGSFKLIYKSNAAIGAGGINIFNKMPDIPAIPVVLNLTTLPFPSPDSTRIDYMLYKSGKFQYAMEVPSGIVANVKLTIPQFTKNNVAFKQEFTVKDSICKGEFDLTGWEVTPTLGRIAIQYEAVDAWTGAPVTVKPLTSFYKFTAFESSVVRGLLGSQTVKLVDVDLPIGFFKNWKLQGNIRFADPKITLNLDNSLGVPTRVTARIASVKDIRDSSINLTSPLSTGVNVNYPNINEIGQFKKTVITLDKSNSNIVDVMNSFPTNFKFGLDAKLSSNTTAGFITDNSKVNAQVKMELPFYVAARDFMVYDTLAIDFSKYNEVNSAQLKIKTDNSLPFDLGFQGYFINSSGAKLDSFATKEAMILKGAPINAAGQAALSSEELAFITLDKERFAKAKQATKLVLRYSLTTTRGGTVPVYIYNYQGVTVKVGVKAVVSL